MDDQLVLLKEPISRIISKETTSRDGRLDVRYKVAFVGYPDSQAASYKAQVIRRVPGGDKLIDAFDASIKAAKPPPEVQPFTQEHWSQTIPPDSEQQLELVQEPSAASASPLQPFTQAPFAEAAIPSQAPGHDASGQPQGATATSSPQLRSPVGANGHAEASSADRAQASAPGSGGSGLVRRLLSRVWPDSSPSQRNGPQPPAPSAARHSLPFFDDLPSMAPIPGRPASRAAPRDVAAQSPVTAPAASGNQMAPAVPPPAAAQLPDQAPAPGASGFVSSWPVQDASQGVDPSASQGPVCDGGSVLTLNRALEGVARQPRLSNGGLAAMVPARQGAPIASSGFPAVASRPSNGFPPIPAGQQSQGLGVQAGPSEGDCNRQAVSSGKESPACSPGNNIAQQVAAEDTAQTAIAAGSPNRIRAPQSVPAAGASPPIAAALPRSADAAGSPGMPPRHRPSASPAHFPRVQSPGKRALPATLRPGYLYTAQPPLVNNAAQTQLANNVAQPPLINNASQPPLVNDIAQPLLVNNELQALASLLAGLASVPGGARMLPNGQSPQRQHTDEQSAAVGGEAQAVIARATGSGVQDLGASQGASPGRDVPAANEHPGVRTLVAAAAQTRAFMDSTAQATPTAKTATDIPEPAQIGAPQASGGAAQAAQLPIMSAAPVAEVVARPGPSSVPTNATMPTVPSPSNQPAPRRVYSPGRAPGAAEWNEYLEEVLPQAWARLGLQPGDRLRVPSPEQQPVVEPSTSAGTADDEAAPAIAHQSAADAMPAPSAARVADDGDAADVKPSVSRDSMQNDAPPSDQQPPDAEDEEQGAAPPHDLPAELHGEQRDRPAPAANDNDDNNDGLPPDVAERMTEKGWADATIVGARTLDEGLDVHVRWSDGFDAWIYHEKIKEQMFRLPKLVEFYESKTKRRPKAPRQPSKRPTTAPAHEASSDKTDTEAYPPSKRIKPQKLFTSLPEAKQVRSGGSREAETGKDNLAEQNAKDGSVDTVDSTSSEEPAPAADPAPRRCARARRPAKVFVPYQGQKSGFA